MLCEDYIVACGQSNAGFLLPRPQHCSVGLRWIKSYQDGTYLATHWAPSSYLEAQLGKNVLRTVGRRVYAWWIQGEADVLVEANADAYLANLRVLRDNIATLSGRSDIRWIFTLLHEDLTNGTSATRATVNAAITTVAGETTGATLLDPSPYGELEDGVHWDTDLRVAMMDNAVDVYRSAA